MGVGRPVKLGMVLPFTSVVTVLSNVVSRVLSNKIEKSLDTASPGATDPEHMSTGRLIVESHFLESTKEKAVVNVPSYILIPTEVFRNLKMNVYFDFHESGHRSKK